MRSNAVHMRWVCRLTALLVSVSVVLSEGKAQGVNDSITGFRYLLQYASEPLLPMNGQAQFSNPNGFYDAAKGVLQDSKAQLRKNTQLNFSNLTSTVKTLPSGISPDLSQLASSVDIKFLGIQSSLSASQLMTGFGKQITDLSFKFDPSKSLKELATKIQQGYAAGNGDLVKKELIKLTQLRQSIQGRLRSQLDSIKDYAARSGFGSDNLLAELNYESIATGSGREALNSLDIWLADTSGTGKNPVHHSYVQQVKSIGALMRNLNATGFEQLIKKYEELNSLSDNNLRNTPAKLRKFIKQNKLPFKFNPLFFFKEIELGNFFRSANFRENTASINTGAIQQGLNLTVNNPLGLQLFLGADVTRQFDDLWLPKSSINSFRSSNTPGLNATVSVKKIDALGGVGVEASKTISKANQRNSFFGKDRSFQRLKIQKGFSYGSHHVQLGVATNVTTYINQTTADKRIPEVKGSIQSYDVSVDYHGTFAPQRLRLDILLRGSSGNGIASMTGFQRPSIDADMRLNKQFANKSMLMMQVGTRSYRMSPISGVTVHRLAASFRMAINRKNLLDLRLSADRSEYSSDVHQSWFNRNVSAEAGHQLVFKRNAIRYLINTRAALRHVDNSNFLQQGGGVVGELYNSVRLMFPNNISLLQSITYTHNSFSNNIFLNGNRFTVDPGVGISKKRVTYTSHLLYESVAGFYQQCGVRFSVSAMNLLNRFSITLSGDARYTLKETVRVFDTPIVSYGNAGFVYQLK